MEAYVRTAKLDRFDDALRHYCVKCGRISRSWALALHKSQNVIEIRDSESRELVYVKDYSHDDGFWGLNEPQLNVIRQSGFKCKRPKLTVLTSEGEIGVHV